MGGLNHCCISFRCEVVSIWMKFELIRSLELVKNRAMKLSDKNVKIDDVIYSSSKVVTLVVGSTFCF